MRKLEFKPKLTYSKTYALYHNILYPERSMERILYLKPDCVLVLVLLLRPVPRASHLTLLGLSSLTHKMEPTMPMVRVK